MGYLHMENKTGWEYKNKTARQQVNKKKKNKKIVIHNSNCMKQIYKEEEHCKFLFGICLCREND